ncbi:MAG: cupin domain-containing protein [Thermoleophilia bacterium]
MSAPEVASWTGSAGADPVAVPATGVASERVCVHGELTTVRFAMAPGAEMGTHASSRPVVIAITEGRVEVTAGGETRTLVPGGAVSLPARHAHALRALDGPARFLLVMGPVPTPAVVPGS